MGVHDLSNDCEAQSGTVPLVVACVVKSHEPLEDSVALGRGDSLAVVGDRQTRVTVPASESESDMSGRVAFGVVSEVRDNLVESRLVTDQPRCAYSCHRNLDLSMCSQAIGMNEHDLVEVDFPEVQCQHPLVEAGKRKKILD